MSPERWEAIKELITEKFEVARSGNEALDYGPGSCEFFEFVGPLGMIRMEWITQPKLVDKQVIASKRIGASSTEKRLYSETDDTHRLQVLTWDEAAEQWQEVKEDILGVS